MQVKGIVVHVAERLRNRGTQHQVVDLLGAQVIDRAADGFNAGSKAKEGAVYHAQQASRDGRIDADYIGDLDQ